MKATVSHFEIPARDPERAARFYREAFGWQVEPLAWEGPAYYKVREVAGAPMAGGIVAKSEAYPHPLLVIHVTAPLEAWVEKLQAAGGAVEQPPTETGGFGRFARFRDPEGNLLGLWEGKDKRDLKDMKDPNDLNDINRPLGP